MVRDAKMSKSTGTALRNAIYQTDEQHYGKSNKLHICVSQMSTFVLALVNYDIRNNRNFNQKNIKVIYCTLVYQLISWWRYEGMKCTTLTLVTGDRQCIARHNRLSQAAFACDPWYRLQFRIWVVELQPPITPQGLINCRGQIWICSIQVINKVFYTSTLHSTRMMWLCIKNSTLDSSKLLWF